MTKRVLLTGAAGRVGRAFLKFHGAEYDLRLVDRDVSALSPADNWEIIHANLSEPDVCQDLCAGIDTVIHLAGDPSPRAGFYESLLDNNFKSAYNIFQAAKDQGCRRVIFASTIQTIEGYPLDSQAWPEMPTKPMNMYAVSKVFGEAMAHYFAHAEGLSCICVRIGAFEGNHPNGLDVYDGRTLSAFASERDLSHLFVRCVEQEDVQFAIVHGISDNRFKRMNLNSTRATVGYAPQDDSFRLFGPQIPDRDRWYEESPESKRRKE